MPVNVDVLYVYGQISQCKGKIFFHLLTPVFLFMNILNWIKLKLKKDFSQDFLTCA